jgi:hypothetical protein
MSSDRGDDEDLYLKPKVYRNRKSKPKIDVAERTHPVHEPYKRTHANYLLDNSVDMDAWEQDVEIDETDWDGRQEYLVEDEDNPDEWDKNNGMAYDE